MAPVWRGLWPLAAVHRMGPAPRVGRGTGHAVSVGQDRDEIVLRTLVAISVGSGA
ncbi:hypothetical protein GCM10009753_33840 [Streptantibioticus ferralitis]